MTTLKNKLLLSISLLVMSLGLFSCEDAIEPDYVKQTFVEGYLIVGRPIEGIMVYNTVPTSSKYNRQNAIIRDAEVTVSTEGKSYNLTYKEGSNPGYAFADESIVVQPEKLYSLKIKLKDGSELTGQTFTPNTINWVRPPKPIFNYPKDTVNLPQVDSLDIEWTKVANRAFYLIRIQCLDSLDYGKYLPQPTDEKNRRAYNIMSKMDDGSYYKNLSAWAFIANTKTPTVWASFKWFGKHNLAVYCPDDNMLNWFVNTFFTNSSISNENLNSIKGGVGVFGSASVTEVESFMLKNQP